ncbi:MAG: hypothetical protein QW559_00115 [Candidatus Woesearchaeota archaeon]
MKKDDKLIMVVEREQLFGKNGEMWFEGFKPHYETDYISIILQKHKYFPRSTAETDPSYKQPIAYLLVVNPVQRSVFVYKRASKDSAYSEKRLQGKWSWGIGGHIEKCDKIEGGNPITSSILREVEEEIVFEGVEKSLAKFTKPDVLGYINYDSNDVGKVHFGILYILETNCSTIRPKGNEIEMGCLKPIEGLQHLLSSPDVCVEEWSRIALEPLIKYLESYRGTIKDKKR